MSFGITGADFVLFASDTSAARSIVKMKSTEDKQKVIGKHLVMACEFRLRLSLVYMTRPTYASAPGPPHLLDLYPCPQTLANREIRYSLLNTSNAT